LSDASDNTPKPVTEIANAVWAMAVQKATELTDPAHPDGKKAAIDLLNLQHAARNQQAREEEARSKISEMEKTLAVAAAVNAELRTQTAYLKTALSTLQDDLVDARAFHKQQIELAESRYQEMENRMMVMLDEERQARKAADETVKRLRFGSAPR
jgi:chromosome segregation ATPase